MKTISARSLGGHPVAFLLFCVSHWLSFCYFRLFTDIQMSGMNMMCLWGADPNHCWHCHPAPDISISLICPHQDRPLQTLLNRLILATIRPLTTTTTLFHITHKLLIWKWTQFFLWCLFNLADTLIYLGRTIPEILLYACNFQDSWDGHLNRVDLFLLNN